MPFLKKKFLYAADFATSTLTSLLGEEKIKTADKLTADYFSSAVLINKGNLQFETQSLPYEAQLTTYRDAVVVNANNDNLPDILLMGNYYDNNVEIGRNDAGFGTILINKGNGKFDCQSLNGMAIKGQVRHIEPIQIAAKNSFVIARNNDSLMLIKFK